MPERHQRQVAHPWLMARPHTEIDVPSGAELAPPASHARRQLEAAFRPMAPAGPGSTTLQDRHAPEVIVKRKRMLESPILSSAVGGENGEAPVGDNPAAPDLHARTPRVFRVEAPAPVPGGRDSPVLAADALADDGRAAETTADPLPPIPARRPRRRASPAVVTFIASHAAHEAERDGPPPMAPAGEVESRGDAAHTEPALVAERRFDELLERTRRLERILSEVRQARDFDIVGQGRPDRVGYAALRGSIEKLKHRAEIARRAEASRAIQWIKRAVVEYGLTAADLGL